MNHHYTPASVGKEEMNCMIAIDANILIYSFDNSAPSKHVAALEFLAELLKRSHTPCLMWQVACETLSWLRRCKADGMLADEEVSSRFRMLLSAYPLVYPTDGVLEFSFELQNRYSLSHWDSILLAACISAEVTTLYSEDMSHGMKYDSVTVFNPFLLIGA